MTVEIKQVAADQLSLIRQDILEIHVEVRHRDFGLDNEFNSRARFDERLTTYSSRPGWSGVLGYDDGVPVGFCFGVPLGADTAWWSSMRNPLPAEYTIENGKRTVALNEIVVRKEWRGSGFAWQLHEAWLAQRNEERVTLLVNPASGDGSVQAVYEAWGYSKIGEQQPFPDSPVYASMIRPVRQN
ncbi:GNAT family N-acetyltransferase [Streptomyces sp. NPDC098789]|uniref:GNAT family N-acetyltransferase n=1 Tax=Streptomyces sp. NPDC098789 TaxID=3366098 RepID=UPI00380E08EE